MYIAPNSTIKICRYIPVNNSYEHVLFFESRTDQYTYFNSQVKWTIEKNYYTRVDRGYIRVQKTMAELIDCNYLMFINNDFENRWFYAFITGIEYVNNEVTQIAFEIDVMQSFFLDGAHGDIILEPCYVEREHTTTDVIGDNVVSENIDTGKLMFDSIGIPPILGRGQYSFVAACSFDTDYEDATGGLYGGVYSGLKYNVFSDYSDLNDFILGASADNKDNIVAIFMMPNAFIATADATSVSYITWNVAKDVNWTYNYHGRTGPRNNKLYTYPFNYLQCVTDNGQVAEYRYEFSHDAYNIVFNLIGTMSASPEVALIPTRYNGIETQNYAEQLTSSAFPQCSWTGDAFKAWLAQNGARMAVNTGFDILGNVIDFATVKDDMFLNDKRVSDSPAHGLVNTGRNIANNLVDIYVADKIANPVHGTQSSYLGFYENQVGFSIRKVHVRPEVAVIIDDYFDRYGYACKRVKLPNLNARRHWTYVKTIGCEVKGSVPYDVETLVKKIFDTGVTFWPNASEVGNYYLDNSPSS